MKPCVSVYAIILHARRGGLVRERVLAVMSVFGNIVVSLSWFGVNMLGVGLHSYGFMDRAFGTFMKSVITSRNHASQAVH
jgi:hypothetical protein